MMRTSVNRFLRIVATALITAGIVVALDVGLTLAWGEPLSGLYAKFEQGQAEDEFDELERAFPATADLEAAESAGDLEERVEHPRRPVRGIPGRHGRQGHRPDRDSRDGRRQHVRRRDGHGVPSARPGALLALPR